MATPCGAAQQHKQTQGKGSEVMTYVLLLGHFDGIDGESWWVEKRKRGWIQKRKELLVLLLSRGEVGVWRKFDGRFLKGSPGGAPTLRPSRAILLVEIQRPRSKVLSRTPRLSTATHSCDEARRYLST